MTIQRGQGRFKYCITLADFYKSYLENNPKGTTYFLSRKEFITLAKALTREYGEFVINEAGVLELNYRLGTIAVTKRKRPAKHLPIDYYQSKIENELVYNFNDHSNGYRYKAFWNKRRCKVPQKEYYSFYFTREWNRQIAKNIKQKVIDYFQFI